eukprot:363275-Chlamydomonas_euryale.AAC.4
MPFPCPRQQQHCAQHMCARPDAGGVAARTSEKRMSTGAGPEPGTVDALQSGHFSLRMSATIGCVGEM